MWKSIGDKWDLNKHDEGKNPRKFRTNGIMIAILIILYLAGSIIFMHVRPEAMFYYYIPAILGALATVASGVMLWLKWKKNNQELDIWLIAAIVVFIFYTYMTSTFI